MVNHQRRFPSYTMYDLARFARRALHDQDVQAALALVEAIRQRTGGSTLALRLTHEIRRWREYAGEFLSPPEERSRVAPREAKRLRVATETTTTTQPYHEMPPRFFPLNSGVGCSNSSYVDKLHSNKKIMAKMADQGAEFSYYNNGQLVTTGATGDQTYIDIMQALVRPDITQMFTDAVQRDELDEGEALSNISRHLYIKDVYVSIDIVNTSNTSCFFELYDCRPKMDIAPEASTNNLPKPAVMINADMSNYTQTSQPQTYMMTDPFLSKYFTSHWTVHKSSRVHLLPGEQHTHYVHWAPNWWTAYAEWWNGEAEDSRWAADRMTYACFIRYHGSPIVADLGSNEFIATYSQNRLAVCWTSRIEYTVGFPQVTFARMSDNFTTLTSEPAQTVLQATGAIVTPAVAAP